MKAYRLSKGVTEHYTSFEELRSAWGLKEFTKQTKDKEKLEKQRERFCSSHLCQACKKPMTWIGGNIMSCQNPSCNGIKHEQVNPDTGETKVWYSTSFSLLDDKGAEISSNLFAEYD